jgi:hypothetical protein
MHSMLPSGFSMSPVCTEILSTLHYKQSHKAITEHFHSDMHSHKLFGATKMCIPCNSVSSNSWGIHFLQSCVVSPTRTSTVYLSVSVICALRWPSSSQNPPCILPTEFDQISQHARMPNSCRNRQHAQHAHGQQGKKTVKTAANQASHCRMPSLSSSHTPNDFVTTRHQFPN